MCGVVVRRNSDAAANRRLRLLTGSLAVHEHRALRLANFRRKTQGRASFPLEAPSMRSIIIIAARPISRVRLPRPLAPYAPKPPRSQRCGLRFVPFVPPNDDPPVERASLL